MKPRGRMAGYGLLATNLLYHPFTTAVAQLHSPSANEVYAVNFDLASRLHASSTEQQQVLSHALRIVHSLESAPTCNRLAALNLINDCQSLEQNPDNVKSDSEMILDSVKSEYAARLAICELLGAKALVPRECAVLVPSPQACAKGRFSSFFSREKTNSPDGEYCYPESTRAQFERCLRALESRPQSWTSYSNARQNAVVMCHASRDAIEREQDLAVYRSLAEVVEHMASALSKSLQDMQTWVAEQLRFAENVRMSQNQAMQELHTNREMTLTTFDTVKGTLQSFSEMLKHTADALRQGLDEKSKTSIDETREEMQGLYKEMAEVNSRHSVLQKNQLELSHETALASLQLNHEAAVYSLNTLSNSIGTLQDQVDVSSGSIENLNRGLRGLNQTVQSLGSATENLRTTIDATTESIQMFATLGGIATNPKLWAAAAMCMFGLWNANRKMAGYFMAVCGFARLLYSCGIHEWFNMLLEHTPQPQIPHLRIFATFVAAQPPSSLLLPGLAIICLLSAAIWSIADSTCLYQYRDDQGEEGVLPRVETPGNPVIPAPRKKHTFNPLAALRSGF